MKIALLFLALLVAMTIQQKQQSKLVWMIPRHPFAGYYASNDRSATNLSPMDSYVMDKVPKGRQPAKQENCDKEYGQQELFPDVQPRRGAQYPVQQRFFFNPFSFLGGAQTTVITSTTTSLTTITSTITVAVITSCVPATQFEATGPCQGMRRRRDTLDMSDLLDGGEGEQFVPPLPYDKSVNARWTFSEREPEIVSSKAESMEEYSRANNRVVNVYVQTLASTVTTYVLSSTTITKTVKLVADPEEGAPGVLKCLPNGFLVC